MSSHSLILENIALQNTFFDQSSNLPKKKKTFISLEIIHSIKVTPHSWIPAIFFCFFSRNQNNFDVLTFKQVISMLCWDSLILFNQHPFYPYV